MSLVAVTGLFFTLILGAGHLRAIQSVTPKDYLVPPKSSGSQDGPLTTVDMVQATAMEGDFRPALTIEYPPDREGTWVAYSFPEIAPFCVGVLWMDQNGGRIIEMLHPADASPLLNWRWTAYLIHTGGTGVLMWWQRKPAGRSGFPRKSPVPFSLRRIAIATGCVLPATGASMLLIWIGGIADDQTTRQLWKKKDLVKDRKRELS